MTDDSATMLQQYRYDYIQSFILLLAYLSAILTAPSIRSLPHNAIHGVWLFSYNLAVWHWSYRTMSARYLRRFRPSNAEHKWYCS